MTTINGVLTPSLQQKPLGQLGVASSRASSASAHSASDFAKIFEALNAEQDGKISPAGNAPAPAPSQGPWETVRTRDEAAAAQAREVETPRARTSAEPTLMDMTQTLSTRLMAQILGNMDTVAA